jgi:nucleoside-diphosphate-sugar epimerase
LGKFVIPNPFGAFEEPRFTAYLVNTWAKGEVAAVNTPDYIRDNIHVDLLAAVYVQFLENLAESGFSQINPSGYVESQGIFAQRFAIAMRKRLPADCEVVLNKQTDFSEPFFRTNTESAERMIAVWNEEAAWDAIANFYAEKLNLPIKTPKA